MYKPVKRLLDVVISSAGLTVLLPLLPLIAAAIKLDSPGAVFFKQCRVGKDKSLFWLYKFRTMRSDTPRDVPTHLMAGGGHITRLGGFLRRSSADELPQLWNILRGDMSVVGPRPALWNQDDLIAEREKYGANAVRPGLTGLAQVMGRDELPIPAKARYDGDYVKNTGILSDLGIMLKTVANVLSAKGIADR
ncbi:MAG: sugar transferase [Oscillospiraceae bacterium]|nr:sugar transferase [Oscillospiraceae bacterium]